VRNLGARAGARARSSFNSVYGACRELFTVWAAALKSIREDRGRSAALDHPAGSFPLDYEYQQLLRDVMKSMARQAGISPGINRLPTCLKVQELNSLTARKERLPLRKVNYEYKTDWERRGCLI